MTYEWRNAAHTVGAIVAGNHSVIVEPGHPLWEEFLTGDPAEFAPEPTLPELDPLETERAQMRLSFAQFLLGLVEQGWISPAEHGAWLSGSGLPAAVAAALATIPETAPDGTLPRLRAQTRALRPSVVERDNDLLALMAHLRGATPEQLDEFFRVYAAV